MLHGRGFLEVAIAIHLTAPMSQDDVRRLHIAPGRAALERICAQQ